jgi:hypothetical protein
MELEKLIEGMSLIFSESKQRVATRCLTETYYTSILCPDTFHVSNQ